MVDEARGDIVSEYKWLVLPFLIFNTTSWILAILEIAGVVGPAAYAAMDALYPVDISFCQMMFGARCIMVDQGRPFGHRLPHCFHHRGCMLRCAQRCHLSASHHSDAIAMQIPPQCRAQCRHYLHFWAISAQHSSSSCLVSAAYVGTTSSDWASSSFHVFAPRFRGSRRSCVVTSSSSRSNWRSAQYAHGEWRRPPHWTRKFSQPSSTTPCERSLASVRRSSAGRRSSSTLRGRAYSSGAAAKARGCRPRQSCAAHCL